MLLSQTNEQAFECLIEKALMVNARELKALLERPGWINESVYL